MNHEREYNATLEILKILYKFRIDYKEAEKIFNIILNKNFMMNFEK